MQFMSKISTPKFIVAFLAATTVSALPAAAPAPSRPQVAARSIPAPVAARSIPAPVAARDNVEAREVEARDGELEKRSTQGGQINVVNTTPYQWEIVAFDEYQIEGSWKAGFERSRALNAMGGTTRIHLEFDTSLFTHETDTTAYATYRMNGCTGTDNQPCSVTMLARGFGGGRFTVSARLDNISAQGYAPGAVIDLGWTENHDCAFILTGDASTGFISSTPPVDWMNQNLGWLKDRKIKDVCMPGSHDSGMSIVTSSTALSFPGNTLTQWHSIGTQLVFGARYFDIRPVISGGEFRLGHYSHIGDISSWQGSSGQKMAEVITQINEFVANNKELVILNFSHELNTDIGNNNYQSFDDGTWIRLLDMLSTDLKNIWITDRDPQNINLHNEPLRNLLTGDKGAVLCIVDMPESLKGQADRGFFRRWQYDPIDEYSGSKNEDTVMNEQIAKMNDKAGGERPFLLSWTITLTDLTDNIPGFSSIRDSADDLNDKLYSRLIPAVSSTKYPSIIYIDSVGAVNGQQRNNLATVALAVNKIAKPELVPVA